LVFCNFVFFITVLTSLVLACIACDSLYKENGLLNYALQIAGIITEPIGWLTSTSTALFAVMVVTIWKGLGYYMDIYLAGLQSISESLYEAADIDGANWWQKVIRITIPMLLPCVLLVSFMSSINAMLVFEVIYVLTGGGRLHRSYTL